MYLPFSGPLFPLQDILKVKLGEQKPIHNFYHFDGKAAEGTILQIEVSLLNIPFDCRDDVAVAETPAPALGDPMDIMTALQLVLKKSRAHGGLSRELHEGAQVIEKHTAHLCVLAEDCHQPDYVKLVKALCADHNVTTLVLSLLYSNGGYSTKQLEEAQMGMAREMSELRLAVDGQQKLMQEVRNQVSPLGSQLKAPSVESSRSKSAEVILSSRIDNGNPVMLRHKRASVELSRFSGEHPDAWVFQVERYFTFYSILPEQQLSMASFYLDGTALEWYRWLFRNKQLVDWTHFASKLLIRFRKRELEDPEGRLAKLRQTSTVADYQARFEAFVNETADIPDTLMVKLFVSGLCLDIKTNVLVHKPSTLDEAISLAHTHEQHLNLEKGPMQPSFARPNLYYPTLSLDL
ncbi:40S ribosomal protein S12 [Capsicum chinense]|nr:40S ribosomal protein S12 [Capsicum chinense]